MDSMLDIRQMFAILRKHLLLIVLSMVGLAVVAFGVAEFLITPQYTSTTQILVNRKSDNSQAAAAYTEQQADVQMISTYKDLITNQVVLKQASKDLKNNTVVVKKAQKANYRTNYDGTKHVIKAAQPAVVKHTGQSYKMSVSELKNSITISNQENSQVFALAVQTNNPEKSAAVVNEVATVFKSKIKKIMDVNNVTIVSKATPNYAETSPNVKLFVAAGAAIGLLISVAYAFAVELMDTSIKGDSYLVETLGLTNLGQIAQIKQTAKATRKRETDSTPRRGNSHRRVR